MMTVEPFLLIPKKVTDNQITQNHRIKLINMTVQNLCRCVVAKKKNTNVKSEGR